MYIADLHTHTIYSDGTHEPLELLLLAKEKGLSGLSITDHDTTDGYSRDLFDKAKELQITLVPGVEISSVLDHHEIHILAYNIDLEDRTFQDFLAKIRKLRTDRNLAILHRVRSMGMKITDEEFLDLQKPSTRVLGRPHIAYLLKQKGYVKDEKEAFQKYLKRHGSAYVQGEKISVIEVIGQIHLAKGKAVLAHPHFIRKERLLRKLIDLPFDGLEGHYALFPKEENEKIITIAREKNWIVTGGSDFHGTNKPYLDLGIAGVGQEIVNKLLAR
jgi:3',5'-nucleoside bisphosphate phosphatase